MPSRTVPNEALRGRIATVAACLVAFAAMALRSLPAYLSPSNPPYTAADVALAAILGLLAISLVRVVWLLPICAVVQRVFLRRHSGEIRWALSAAIAVSALAWGALLLPVALEAFQEDQRYGEWLRSGPTAIDSALFLLTWFLLYAVLSPTAATTEPVVAPAPHVLHARISWRRLAGTLGVLVVLAWTGALGLVGGVFLVLSGDGEYRLQSIVASPRGAVQACAVEWLTPGGGLRSVYGQVYLVRTPATWSPRRRGLLVWQAPHLRVTGVAWDSERSLRVRARDRSAFVTGSAQAFSREGFGVRTEIEPESTGVRH